MAGGISDYCKHIIRKCYPLQEGGTLTPGMESEVCGVRAAVMRMSTSIGRPITGNAINVRPVAWVTASRFWSARSSRAPTNRYVTGCASFTDVHEQERYQRSSSLSLMGFGSDKTAWMMCGLWKAKNKHKGKGGTGKIGVVQRKGSPNRTHGCRHPQPLCQRNPLAQSELAFDG